MVAKVKGERRAAVEQLERALYVTPTSQSDAQGSLVIETTRHKG